jgi:hypothetical protein
MLGQGDAGILEPSRRELLFEVRGLGQQLTGTEDQNAKNGEQDLGELGPWPAPGMGG